MNIWIHEKVKDNSFFSSRDIESLSKSYYFTSKRPDYVDVLFLNESQNLELNRDHAGLIVLFKGPEKLDLFNASMQKIEVPDNTYLVKSYKDYLDLWPLLKQFAYSLEIERKEHYMIAGQSYINDCLLILDSKKESLGNSIIEDALSLKDLEDCYATLLKGIFGFEEVNEVENFIDKFLSNNKLGLRAKKITEKPRTNKIIPLFFHANMPTFYYVTKTSGSDFLDSLLVILLVKLSTLYANMRELVDQFKKKDDFWEVVLNTFNFPIALFNTEGELRVFNQEFIGLNILSHECFAFQDGKKIISQNQRSLIVKKIRVESEDEEGVLFVLLESIFDRFAQNDNEQLKILTSSVAHELKNPLAGILAALDYLKIDNDFDHDDKEVLDEMKKSALRCKEMVETFLGFAHNDLEYLIYDLKSCIDQAVNLTRFRVVESNTKIEYRYINNNNGQYLDLNPSSLTIVFYLIFGELITSYSHHMLLTFGNNRSNIIKMDIKNEGDEININLATDFSFCDNLIESKLLKHFLNMNELKVDLNKKMIRIRRK